MSRFDAKSVACWIASAGICWASAGAPGGATAEPPRLTERVLDLCLAHSDWNGFAARAADSERRGLLRGRGIVTFLEWTGAAPCRRSSSASSSFFSCPKTVTAKY